MECSVTQSNQVGQRAPHAERSAPQGRDTSVFLRLTGLRKPGTDKSCLGWKAMGMGMKMGANDHAMTHTQASI